jgi:hypothetical protein
MQDLINNVKEKISFMLKAEKLHNRNIKNNMEVLLNIV